MKGKMYPKALTAALLCLLASLLLASSAMAGPELDVKTEWGPTNLTPGGTGLIKIYIKNLGDAPAPVLEKGLVVTDQLPPGVTWVRHAPLDLLHIGQYGTQDTNGIDGPPWDCPGASGASTVTCTTVVRDIGPMEPASTPPGGGASASYLLLRVKVSPGAPLGFGTNVATVSVPGSVSGSAVDQIPIEPTPAGFGLVPNSVGDGTGLFDDHFPHGEILQQAGAHPYEMRVEFRHEHES